MGKVFENHSKRAALLKQSHIVKEIWEHEYDFQLKNNSEFKQFISGLDLEKFKYIEPREALYGGRTECCKTFYECKDDSVCYSDSRSMYLRVLRDARLPKGHPVVKHCLTHDMGEVSNYFCIAKAKVLAASALYLPLLPYRSKTSKY